MTINGTAVEMLFTSVSGHLMELEFTEQYTSWRGCSPLDLYNAPVIKRVPQVCGSLMVWEDKRVARQVAPTRRTSNQ